MMTARGPEALTPRAARAVLRVSARATAIDTAELRGLGSALIPASRRAIQQRLELLAGDPELLIALRCQLEDRRDA